MSSHSLILGLSHVSVFHFSRVIWATWKFDNIVFFIYLITIKSVFGWHFLIKSSRFQKDSEKIEIFPVSFMISIFKIRSWVKNKNKNKNNLLPIHTNIHNIFVFNNKTINILESPVWIIYFGEYSLWFMVVAMVSCSSDYDRLTVHCKTYESHVPHKFTKMQSGPMTNVISPDRVKIRVL
jgi:hypothetical protein